METYDAWPPKIQRNKILLQGKSYLVKDNAILHLKSLLVILKTSSYRRYQPDGITPRKYMTDDERFFAVVQMYLF
jgi:hypothetical protein